MYMKYKLLLAFAFFVVLFVPSAHAQDVQLDGYNSACLAAIANYKAPNCLDSWPNGEGHTVELRIQNSTLNPQPNTTTYVFSCLTGTNQTTAASWGPYCTTGNPTIDMQLFGKREDYDKLAEIAANSKAADVAQTAGQVGGIGDVDGATAGTTCDGNGYTPHPEMYTEGDPKQLKTDSSSPVPAFNQVVTWTDQYYNDIVSHQWSWVQKATATGDTGTSGTAGGVQQGNLLFEHLKDIAKDCAVIAWDPKGYVFDARTLYPVKGVGVRIAKRGTDGQYANMVSRVGLTNPTTTNVYGQYSFYVEPGFYKMSIDSTNVSLAPLSVVKSGYETLFRDKKGELPIYQQDQEVQEFAGVVGVHHIPVNVVDERMLIKENDVTHIVKNETRTASGAIRLTGRVQLPKSTVILTKKLVDGQGQLLPDVVTRDVTDALGEYNLTVPQRALSNGKNGYVYDLQVGFEPNAIYTGSTPFTPTAKSTFTVSAMPAYLEGIAYDPKGVVIPNAIVGVYPFFSEKPMYVTLADANGHFRIGSQHIPQLSYELRYKKQNGQIVEVSGATYVKQNASFFGSNSIDPYTVKTSTVRDDATDKQRLVASKRDTTMTIPRSSGRTQTTASTSKSQGYTPSQNGGVFNSTTMQGVVMIVVILFVLVGIAVGAFVMMKSKQTQGS